MIPRDTDPSSRTIVQTLCLMFYQEKWKEGEREECTVLTGGRVLSGTHNVITTRFKITNNNITTKFLEA